MPKTGWKPTFWLIAAALLVCVARGESVCPSLSGEQLVHKATVDFRLFLNYFLCPVIPQLCTEIKNTRAFSAAQPGCSCLVPSFQGSNFKVFPAKDLETEQKPKCGNTNVSVMVQMDGNARPTVYRKLSITNLLFRQQHSVYSSFCQFPGIWEFCKANYMW